MRTVVDLLNRLMMIGAMGRGTFLLWNDRHAESAAYMAAGACFGVVVVILELDRRSSDAA